MPIALFACFNRRSIDVRRFQARRETNDDHEINAIVGNGGAESQCGWCKDPWGFSWQITPRALISALENPDRAAAKRAMNAMLEMKQIDIAAIEAAVGGKGVAA